MGDEIAEGRTRDQIEPPLVAQIPLVRSLAQAPVRESMAQALDRSLVQALGLDSATIRTSKRWISKTGLCQLRLNADLAKGMGMVTERRG